MEPNITAIFISGFLCPPNYISHPSKTLVSNNVRLISVYPSPTGSLHDRACEIFYELKGGIVDYGEKHSKYHKHSRYGRCYSHGKYMDWSEQNPIIIIGYSVGCLTAWVLQNYLANGYFEGFKTNSNWAIGLLTLNAPLNGTLSVYSKGLHTKMPPIARWGSVGYLIGWLAHIAEYLDSDILRSVFDFRQDHRSLSWKNRGSWKNLLFSCLGYCLHSGTDNIAFDVSIHSQLVWSNYLRTLPNCYYINIVGKSRLEAPHHSTTNLLNGIHRYLQKFLHDVQFKGTFYSNVAGLDTSHWLDHGTDGLLSVYTQEYPRLVSNPRSSNNPVYQNAQPLTHKSKQWMKLDPLLHEMMPGEWNYIEYNLTHIQIFFGCESTWRDISLICAAIHAKYRLNPHEAVEPEPSPWTVTSHPPDMQEVHMDIKDRSVMGSEDLKVLGLFGWVGVGMVGIQLMEFQWNRSISMWGIALVGWINGFVFIRRDQLSSDHIESGYSALRIILLSSYLSYPFGKIPSLDVIGLNLLLFFNEIITIHFASIRCHEYFTPASRFVLTFHVMVILLHVIHYESTVSMASNDIESVLDRLQLKPWLMALNVMILTPRLLWQVVSMTSSHGSNKTWHTLIAMLWICFLSVSILMIFTSFHLLANFSGYYSSHHHKESYLPTYMYYVWNDKVVGFVMMIRLVQFWIHKMQDMSEAFQFYMIKLNHP